MANNVFDDIDDVQFYLKSLVEEDSLDSDDDYLLKSKDNDEDDDEEDDDEKEEDDDDMEKSIDINAAPILKAVSRSNDLNAKRIEQLTKSVESLTGIIKSFSLEKEEMIKSIQNDVKKIGDTPINAQGVRNANEISNSVMIKSLGNLDEPVRISRPVITGLLLKGIQTGEIDRMEIDKFEMTPGSGMGTLQKSTQNYIIKNIQGGN